LIGMRFKIDWEGWLPILSADDFLLGIGLAFEA